MSATRDSEENLLALHALLEGSHTLRVTCGRPFFHRASRVVVPVDSLAVGSTGAVADLLYTSSFVARGAGRANSSLLASPVQLRVLSQFCLQPDRSLDGSTDQWSLSRCVSVLLLLAVVVSFP